MASDTEDNDGLSLGSVFQEPEGFLPPPKPPTFAEHRMLSGQTIKLRLVGDHPLYVSTIDFQYSRQAILNKSMTFID